MKRFILAGAVAAAALFVACGGDGSSSMPGMDQSSMASPSIPAGAIEVKLTNWQVTPATTELKAGNVTFAAVHQMEAAMDNEGGATHELLVTSPDKVLLALRDIKPGESKSGSVDLAPGTYELSCQVMETVKGQDISHYAKGMRTTITVK